jgi:hypothetical protein
VWKQIFLIKKFIEGEMFFDEGHIGLEQLDYISNG